MPQRIPSPRELQYHTQSIMQNALIRKKLEEQRENFRKRQEAQAQAQTQNNNSINISASGIGASQASNTTSTITTTPAQAPIQVNAMPMGPTHSSPVKHTASPTPLAFTPTSVLRKMTAEKDTDGSSNISSSVGNNPNTASIVSAAAGGNALLNSIANSGNKAVQIQGPMAGNLLQQQQRLLQGTNQPGQNTIQQQLTNVMANVQIGQSIRGIPQVGQNQLTPQNMAVAVQQPTVRSGPVPQNMTWLQQQMQAQNQAPKSQGMSK